MSKEIIEENQSTGGKKLKFLIIVISVIAIIQLGILFVVFKEPLMNTVAALIPEKEVILVDYPLNSMQVNLADKDRDVFLRTTLNLKCEGEDSIGILDANLPQIQARVIEILRSKTLDEIKTIEKTKVFSQYIKDELNKLLDQDVIADVLFIEFLYQ